ncbi:MAG: LCP family protein, partial [Anaerolineaceae bacterium]|nr:LCP family protein [Anaerolineaceae bacterium]
AEVPQNYVPEGEEFVVPLQTSNDPAPDPWDGASRVTILVMGLDFRDWEAGETPRTDTMILFTLDPLTYTAGMLSIPRDMWVNIPGFGHGKINTAYFLGEIYNLPGGGPGLAVDTVEEFLGVPINFYAQVDFQAFVDFIDEIGGIDMHVKEEIVVDPVGPENTLILRPGVQTLDGASALAYARARYTEGGDFDRAQRQQEVILAVRDNILNFYSLPKLVAKAPALYEDISQGVKTNLSLQQTIQLAWIVQQISLDNISRAAIGTEHVSFGTSPDGLFILKPIPDKIRIVRDEIFAVGGPIGPEAISDDPKTLMLDENARISVQNGTSTEGLATLSGEYFASQGLMIVEQTNAAQNYPNSELIIYNGKPYTIQYLADLMAIPPSRIFNQFNPDANADVVIILGENWANENPMP